MNQPTDQPNDPALLGVIHRAGDEWRILVIRTDSRIPSLVESRVVDGSNPSALAAALAEHRPGRVLNVLPAARIICRSCPLPDADPDHLAQALVLQAEAHQGNGTPAHRLGAALLDGGFGENTRTGLIISWPLASNAEIPSLPMALDHTSEVAALAALIGSERPTEPLLSVDRVSGSIALALPHANGVLFRGTHEAGAGSDDWLKRIQRVTTESALSSGHTAPFAEGLLDRIKPQLAALSRNHAGVWLPETVATAARKRVSGLPSDEAWLVRFGIALGAALAATSSLNPLCLLAENEAIESPSLPEQVVTRLSSPRTAVAVVLGCLLFLALTPMTSAGLRLAILNLRHPDLSERKAEVDSIKAQLVMFDALEDRSWSMTKVLGDIMCATPEGIAIESLRVSSEKGGGFSMNGVANDHHDSTGDALIHQLQTNLNASRIFEQVSPSWDAPNAFNQYEFTIIAKVIRPHVRPKYAVEQDFGIWTLAARRDGEPPPESAVAKAETDSETEEDPEEGSSPVATDVPTELPPNAIAAAPRAPTGENITPEQASPPEAGEDRTPPRGHSGHSAGPEGTRGDGVDSGDVLNDTELAKIPEALTQGQIDVMTRPEVMAKLSEGSNARTIAKRIGDKELEERLNKERKMLMVHLRIIGR